MSSVSGIKGELSHLTPSLFSEGMASLVLFDWGFAGIDETAGLNEYG